MSPFTLFKCLPAAALFLAQLSVSLAAPDQYCPPFGPVLPSPRYPSTNAAVQEATRGFESTVNNVTSTFQYSAVSISIRSIHEANPFFTTHYTPPIADPRSARVVDSQTVFRIGSASKVFTVLAVLKLPGVSLDDRVTKYVPELRDMAVNTPDLDSFPVPAWDDVTLGALASHLGGIGVDFATDLTNFPVPWTALGLPSINASLSPNCAGVYGLPPCNRTEFFREFGNHHPVFGPFTSPVYSNIGYSILAFVVEAVSNTTFDAFVRREIIEPLQLAGTSPSKAPTTDHTGFIPADDVYWGSYIGFESPAGGFYSSVDDLLSLASAILGNKVFTPANTRKWLKPVTSTSSPGLQVGAVWEIYRSDNLTADKRLIEVYTKSGDVGNYHANLCLVPDYGIVMAILVAGNETTSNTAEQIMSQAVTRLLPAFEVAGRQEAEQSFAGTYRDNQTNSTLVLSLDDDPGLAVSNWTMRGVDVPSNYQNYALLGTLPADTPVTVRLYPTNLQCASQQSWRAVFEVGNAADNEALDSTLFWSRGSCSTWDALDRLVYQYKALDEIVFMLNNGSARSAMARGFQLELEKQE